jgi:hypothetical protein
MTWDDIKNLPAEINGKNKHSTNDPDKIYNNEEIMIMFIYKLNDRYRYSRIVDMGVQGDMDRLFLEGYIDNKNYLDLAEKQIDNYFLTNLKKQIQEIISKKDIKKIPLIFKRETFDNNDIDVILLAAAVPEITNLDKFRYLAKLLYEKDNKYLEYAKESIINYNQNISLDKMVLGADGITQTTVKELFENCKYMKYFNLIIIIILIILLLYYTIITLNSS